MTPAVPSRAGNRLALLVALLAGAFSLSPGRHLDGQTIDRWLYVPHGDSPRLDREPIDRTPLGHSEFRFSYEGRPNVIHRFGRGVAADYPPRPVVATAPVTGNDLPSINEVERMMSIFHQAAIEAELEGPTAPPASGPDPLATGTVATEPQVTELGRAATDIGPGSPPSEPTQPATGTEPLPPE